MAAPNPPNVVEPGMELQQLEARVQGIVEAAISGQQTEDSRVELKARWPEPGHRAARQIAGLANAAGGGHILWILGVNEGKRLVTPLEQVEPSNWWSTTRRWFDDQPPTLTHSLSVVVAGGQRVVALLFNTARTPYVVSTPEGGQVQREVPWREGNSTRSAHRHEVLRSIVDQVRVPRLVLQDCSVVLLQAVPDDTRIQHRDGYGNALASFRIEFSLGLLLSASDKAYLPEHGQVLSLTTKAGMALRIETIELIGPHRFDGFGPSGGRRRVPAGDIQILGQSALAVSGSGEIRLNAQMNLTDEQGKALERSRSVELRLTLPVDQARQPVETHTVLKYQAGSRQDPRDKQEFQSHIVRSRFDLT